MRCDPVERWLLSGRSVRIGPHSLTPVEHSHAKGKPLSSQKGQAEAFFLKDEHGAWWILKKFRPTCALDSDYLRKVTSVPPREASGLLDVVLLPYVALALTVFLVLLLLAVSRVLHGREPWRHWEPARSLRTTAKPRMRRGRDLRKETRPPKSTEERAISVSKNTAIGKKTERTRFDS
jgi:hypothetical protein